MDSKFTIQISQTGIFSTSQRAFQIENSKKLGEKKNGKIFYSNYEAMFLLDSGKAEIQKNQKTIKEEQAIKLFSRNDKDFFTKFIVFKHLVNKGYIVKTGSKFGSEFRVYEQSINKHAKWLVFPVKSSKNLDLKEFISKTRVSHSTGKKLLLAIVDDESSVLFYEVDWMKM